MTGGPGLHRPGVLAAGRVVLLEREIERRQQLVEVRPRKRHRLHRTVVQGSRPTSQPTLTDWIGVGVSLVGRAIIMAGPRLMR